MSQPVRALLLVQVGDAVLRGRGGMHHQVPGLVHT